MGCTGGAYAKVEKDANSVTYGRFMSERGPDVERGDEENGASTEAAINPRTL